MSSNMDDLT